MTETIEALAEVERLIAEARVEASARARQAAGMTARDEARGASKVLRELLGKVRALREGGA